MTEGIEVTIAGHKGCITKLLPSHKPYYRDDGEEFTAVVEFSNDHPKGILWMGVTIPAKRYERDELVTVVERNGQKRYERMIEEDNKRREEVSRHERLMDFARQVDRELGLEEPEEGNCPGNQQQFNLEGGE